MNSSRFTLAAAVLALAAAPAWPAVTRTPQLTEGPFYPFNSSNSLPALTERDADLTKLKDGKAASAGKTLLLSGVLRDLEGKPLAGATVEIWQTDDGGIYYHSGNRASDRDQAFQFFGECVTDAEGKYAFRTVLPGLYTGRIRHIHFKVKRSGADVLTSQFIFEDQRSEFGRDGVTARLKGDTLETIVLAPKSGTDSAGATALIAAKDICVDPEARPGAERGGPGKRKR